MQGSIVHSSVDKQSALIYEPNSASIYAVSFPHKEGELLNGFDCEFNVLSQPGIFRHGTAEIVSVSPVSLTANTLVGLSRTGSLEGHTVIKENHDFLIAGEGGSEQEARAAMTEKAIECKVNALLDIKLECVIRPGVKTVLFRYTGRPAVVTGDKYNPEPGVVKPVIDESKTRRNSPNEAQVRYIRVLLISLLFIALPCFTAMGQNGMLPNAVTAQVLSAVTIMICMGVFMFIAFKKKTGFILSLKNPRK